jgi:putative addiction module component (TIGR02574 family)
MRYRVAQRQAAQRSGLTQVLAPRNASVYTLHMSQTRPNFLDLSVAERIQLAEDIWDSIAVEGSDAASLNAAQVMEVQSRLTAHDQDPSDALPWEQVRSELLQRNH